MPYFYRKRAHFWENLLKKYSNFQNGVYLFNENSYHQQKYCKIEYSIVEFLLYRHIRRMKQKVTFMFDPSLRVESSSQLGSSPYWPLSETRGRLKFQTERRDVDECFQINIFDFITKDT